MFLQKQNLKNLLCTREWKSLPEDRLSASKKSPVTKYLFYCFITS